MPTAGADGTPLRCSRCRCRRSTATSNADCRNSGDSWGRSPMHELDEQLRRYFDETAPAPDAPFDARIDESGPRSTERDGAARRATDPEVVVADPLAARRDRRRALPVTIAAVALTVLGIGGVLAWRGARGRSTRSPRADRHDLPGRWATRSNGLAAAFRQTRPASSSSRATESGSTGSATASTARSMDRAGNRWSSMRERRHRSWAVGWQT